ncbi:L-lactate permease [Clostridium pascui]|nr:L-lactate permease [Clostridium pascui]
MEMLVSDVFKSSPECVPNTLRTIVLVIMATVFTYNLSLHTKNINVIKA